MIITSTILELTHKDSVFAYEWSEGDKILVLYIDDLGQEHLEVFENFDNGFSNGKSSFQELDDECDVIAWEKIEAEPEEPARIDFRILFNYLGSSAIAFMEIDSQGRDVCYCGDISLPTDQTSLVVSSDGTVLEYNPKNQEEKIKLIQSGEDFVDFKEYRRDNLNFRCQSVSFKEIIDKVFVITDQEEQEAVREFIKNQDWQKILRSYMPPMSQEYIMSIFTNAEGRRITGSNKK